MRLHSFPSNDLQREILAPATDPPAPVAPVPALEIELETPVEWMRFCDVCESDQRFVADRTCAIGLIGRCSRCLERRIAPFTRTTSEAA